MHYELGGDIHSCIHVGILSDVPAGLAVHLSSINSDISRWAHHAGLAQCAPSASIVSGLYEGKTTGNALVIALDCTKLIALFTDDTRSVIAPGCSELPFLLKYDLDKVSTAFDVYAVITPALKIALAGVAREFLAELGVDVLSCVTGIGETHMRSAPFGLLPPAPLEIESSELRCPCAQTTRAMLLELESARTHAMPLTSSFALAAYGVVAGLGYRSDDYNLKSQIASALFAIDGLCELRLGCDDAALSVGPIADDITFAKQGFTRASNHCAGLEGSMSTGMPLVINARMLAPWQVSCASSVDLQSKEYAEFTGFSGAMYAAAYAAIQAEAQLSFVLAQAYQHMFAGDTLADCIAAHDAYRRRIRRAAR